MMSTAPELRPGDEGFDGFRMRLPEDCVEYMLFILGNKTDNNNTPSLESVRKAAEKKLDELAKDYIWQREPFRLETRIQKGVYDNLLVSKLKVSNQPFRFWGFLPPRNNALWR